MAPAGDRPPLRFAACQLHLEPWLELTFDMFRSFSCHGHPILETWGDRHVRLSPCRMCDRPAWRVGSAFPARPNPPCLKSSTTTTLDHSSSRPYPGYTCCATSTPRLCNTTCALSYEAAPGGLRRDLFEFPCGPLLSAESYDTSAHSHRFLQTRPAPIRQTATNPRTSRQVRAQTQRNRILEPASPLPCSASWGLVLRSRLPGSYCSAGASSCARRVNGMI
jgi:hypothetical protein